MHVYSRVEFDFMCVRVGSVSVMMITYQSLVALFYAIFIKVLFINLRTDFKNLIIIMLCIIDMFCN